MKKLLAGMVGVGMLCVAVTSFSADEKKVEPKYKGVKSCIGCHKKIDDSVTVWEASKHSKAYESLSSEAAKAHEAPTKTEVCVKCHVTGLGKDGGFDMKGDEKANENVTNVTCESCHGPSEAYAKLMMKAMSKKEITAEEYAEAGLIIPTEETCKGCHSGEGNPFAKEFKFEDALKAIKHGEKLKKEE